MSAFAYTAIASALALVPILYVLRRNQQASSRSPPPPVSLEFFQAMHPPSGPVVVVTGGSGFVGRRIIEMLLQEPQQYRVVVLDVLLPVVKSANVTYIRGDICNPAHVEAAFKGADAVLHVASIIPSLKTQASPIIERVNVGGTRVVIDACKVPELQQPGAATPSRRCACVTALTRLTCRSVASPALSTPPPPPSSSGAFRIAPHHSTECEAPSSPQDFDLRGVDESTPVRCCAALQPHSCTLCNPLRMCLISTSTRTP